MNTDEVSLALALDEAKDDVRRAAKARGVGLLGIGLSVTFFILMILWPSVVLFTFATLALIITSSVQMYKSRRLPAYRKTLRRVDAAHTRAVLEYTGAVIDQWPGGGTSTTPIQGPTAGE